MGPPPPSHTEVSLDEPNELVLDETENYEICVETCLSPRSVSGLDQNYAIRNKTTQVVEMRWGAYAEALQGILVLQQGLDKFQYEFAKATGRVQ